MEVTSAVKLGENLPEVKEPLLQKLLRRLPTYSIRFSNEVIAGACTVAAYSVLRVVPGLRRGLPTSAGEVVADLAVITCFGHQRRVFLVSP
jgi:hypothetical protein